MFDNKGINSVSILLTFNKNKGDRFDLYISFLNLQTNSIFVKINISIIFNLFSTWTKTWGQFQVRLEIWPWKKYYFYFLKSSEQFLLKGRQILVGNNSRDLLQVPGHTFNRKTYESELTLSFAIPMNVIKKTRGT